MKINFRLCFALEATSLYFCETVFPTNYHKIMEFYICNANFRYIPNSVPITRTNPSTRRENLAESMAEIKSKQGSENTKGQEVAIKGKQGYFLPGRWHLHK